MANKFPTAAVYWPAIHCEPKLVTVRGLVKTDPGPVVANCGPGEYYHLADLYDSDMLTFAERAHNMWKATLDLKKMMIPFKVV